MFDLQEVVEVTLHGASLRSLNLRYNHLSGSYSYID